MYVYKNIRFEMFEESTLKLKIHDIESNEVDQYLEQMMRFACHTQGLPSTQYRYLISQLRISHVPKYNNNYKDLEEFVINKFTGSSRKYAHQPEIKELKILSKSNGQHINIA